MSEEKTININQNADMLTDSFTVDLADFTYLLTDKGEIEVAMGYGDKNITVMQGVIDEFTITRGKNNAEIAARGRDKLKLALESEYNLVCTWRAVTGDGGTGTALPSAAVMKAGQGARHGASVLLGEGILASSSMIPLIPKNEFGEVLPHRTGNVTAKEVATLALESIGLNLIWDCPNYLVVNALEPSRGFNGLVSAILRELVEPFQQTEISKVDIFIRNDTVYIKKRMYPYKKDFDYDINDVRIKGLTLTVSGPDKIIRNIYISHDLLKPTDEDTDTAEVIEKPDEPPAIDDFPPVDDGEQTDVWVVAPEEKEREVETTDVNGNVIVRDIYITNSINGIVIRERMQRYKVAGHDPSGIAWMFDLTEESDTVYNYVGGTPNSYFNVIESKEESKRVWTQKFYCASEGKDVGANHILEQPSHLGYVVSLGTYRSAQERKTTRYAYNGAFKIVSEDTYEESHRFDDKGAETGVTTKEEVLTYKTLTKDLVEVTRSSYENGVLISTVKDTQSGNLPGPTMTGPVNNISRKRKTPSGGGPGPGGGDDSGPGEAASSGASIGTGTRNEPLTLWWKKYKVNDTGEDLRIHDNLLPEAALSVLACEVINEQMRKKYALSLAILPMPWLRKGHVLRLRGTIPDGRGNEIDITDMTFIITDLTYRRGRKEYTGTLSVVTWV